MSSSHSNSCFLVQCGTCAAALSAAQPGSQLVFSTQSPNKGCALCVFFVLKMYNVTVHRHSANMDGCGESHTSKTSSVQGTELRRIKDMKHQPVTLSGENA